MGNKVTSRLYLPLSDDVHERHVFQSFSRIQTWIFSCNSAPRRSPSTPYSPNTRSSLWTDFSTKHTAIYPFSSNTFSEAFRSYWSRMAACTMDYSAGPGFQSFIARDSVVSIQLVLHPRLIQTSVRALVSFYLTPFSARVGHGIVERLPRHRKEGLGVGWLRNWVKSLGLSAGTAWNPCSILQMLFQWHCSAEIPCLGGWSKVNVLNLTSIRCSALLHFRFLTLVLVYSNTETVIFLRDWKHLSFHSLKICFLNTRVYPFA